MATVETARDDGSLEVSPSEDNEGAEPADCDCDGLGGFPCWKCVQTGQTDLHN